MGIYVLLFSDTEVSLPLINDTCFVCFPKFHVARSSSLSI